MPARKLDSKMLRYIVSARSPKQATVVARQLNISKSLVYSVRSHYKKTGDIPYPKQMGRPKKIVESKTVRIILGQHKRYSRGVTQLTKYIKKDNPQISHYTVYNIMKENGLVTPSPAKSKRRKWVRYERKYSNAMWHVDWHAIKNPRLKSLNFIAFLDDASRCITGFGVFQSANSQNSVLVLRDAIKKFGVPGQVLSDHGTQFTGNKTSSKKRWTPTLFEEELIHHGITHILARVKHPQTNGKLERFFRTLETEMIQFNNIPEFIEFYNQERIHFSLDMDNYETPLLAFRNKKANKAIRNMNPKWMEEDVQ